MQLVRPVNSVTALSNLITMIARMLTKLIVAAALTVCSGLVAADAPAGPASGPKPADRSQAKAAAASGDVKKDMEKFSSQRDAMLAERQALINQLKNATEEQRKAILEKMKEMGDAQRELSKQIRDDLRKLRQGSGSPGRG